jgi:two-component system invasion response regulator UvrY
MPSVLIVDDNLLVRHGLRQILSQEYRGLVFGEARNSEEVAVRLARRSWDLVVLEISIPGKDGSYVLEEIRRSTPSTRVLVLSRHTDPQCAAQARQMQACGYVGKDVNRAELLRAFKSVFAGEEHFDACLSIEIVEVPASRRILSDREHGVMMAFAGGKRVGEIAAELNLSVKTVSTYKRRILDKLGLHSTADLVRFVIENNLS